ncbi:HamA C-terminal domain-containing protein [Pseudomonas sp. KB_12]|uniref:HamA C-terminal domain-containing protein n=1 Tax=Pseudomonas sp. KB_12 TaxID=3233034 RepID=UPI003F9E2817
MEELDFARFLSVAKSDLESCLDVIEHSERIGGIAANMRVHHMRFDGNGRPAIKPLAEALYQYIIEYCISCKNRPEQLNTRQAAKLTKEARELFRHPPNTPKTPDTSGEAGEALLFFLNEAILEAPQIVAKMELKTNRKDEVKGSDGIHIKWCAEDNMIDFYFGESKMYQDVNRAVSAALESVDSFHEGKMYKHEFNMVTKHFKYADEKVRTAVMDLIKFGEPGPGVRINHACLIGYDWAEFSSDPTASLKKNIEDFRSRLLQDSSRLSQILNNKFSKFEKKHLRFEVFFIPFPSVQEFRDAFNEALN